MSGGKVAVWASWLLVGWACMEASAPGTLDPAQVEVILVLPPSTPTIWLPADTDTLGVSVRRAGRTDPIVDTAVTIADSLSLETTVPLVYEVESFVGAARVVMDGQMYFMGVTALQLRPGIDTTVTLLMTYVGPGARAATFHLSARDSTLQRGDTTSLMPQVADSMGQPISNPPVRYESLRPSIVATDVAGIANALIGGRDTARVRGFLPTGLNSSTVLHVVPAPSLLLVAEGDEQSGNPGVPLAIPIVVQLLDDLERPVSGVTVTFEPDSGAGAVDPTTTDTDTLGLASTAWTLGDAFGPQYLTVSAPSVPPARVTAAAVRKADSVAVDPQLDTLTAIGDTLRLDAVAYDVFREPIGSAVFEWESSDTSIAAVDDTGLVTAHAEGTVTITATVDGVSDTANVVVALEPQIDFIIVSPNQATIDAIGGTQQFTAVAYDALEQSIPDVTFNWESSDPGVATIDDDGLATALAEGSTTISATADGVTDTAPLTVDVPTPVVEIAVTPPSATLFSIGATQQFTATAYDANGDPIPEATFTWLSSDETVATIDANGLATALQDGKTTIGAQSGGVTGLANLDVSPITIERTWVGGALGSPSDWFAPDNWSPAGVPAPNDAITIADAVDQPVLTGRATAGSVTIDGGSLMLGGNTLSVTGDVTVAGFGDLVMGNAADSLMVGGDLMIAFGAFAQLTEGVLAVAGDVTQDGLLAASGGHRTVLNGSATQTLTFNDPLEMLLNDVEITNGAGDIVLATTVVVGGRFSSDAGTISTLRGTGDALTVRGDVDIDGLVFDNVAFVAEFGTGGSELMRIDRVTFQGFDPASVQLTIEHAGASSAFQFTELVFLSPPTTGYYLQAIDVGPNDDTDLVIDLVSPTPSDGAAFTTTSGGAVVNWVP